MLVPSLSGQTVVFSNRKFQLQSFFLSFFLSFFAHPNPVQIIRRIEQKGQRLGEASRPDACLTLRILRTASYSSDRGQQTVMVDDVQALGIGHSCERSLYRLCAVLEEAGDVAICFIRWEGEATLVPTALRETRLPPSAFSTFVPRLSWQT